ncbi:MAG: HTTM domain-containing protein [Planctomycetales bacterium]
MNLIEYVRELRRAASEGWNRFWFTPADPATLCLIRVFAGTMLFYTHLVWSLELEAFFGPDGWLSREAVGDFLDQGPIELGAPTAVQAAGEAPVLAAAQRNYAWAPSYFWLIESPAVLWTTHVLALAVFLMFALGLCTRVTSVLSLIAALSYVHRVPGATFGLDQINILLTMYLMVGPCGACYSLDRWLARRRGRKEPDDEPKIGANVSIRLIQFHFCVIYFFAGISKLSGETWWDGTAIWMAVSNAEYQTINMYWMAWHPVVVDLLTTITVVWEIFFCVLIWNRLTRPLVLVGAIALHLGIGLCMGMMTFALIMLVGCMSFVPPRMIRSWLALVRLAPPPRLDQRVAA